MKKNTTFLSLIALLLALLLTLTACDLQSLLNKNTAEDTEAETTKPEKEFNAPDAVETNVNYTSLLNKWTQYMEYVTPTVPNSLSAQHVVSTENLYDYEETNGFLVTEIRRENKRTLTPEGNPTVVSVNVDMAIYDKVGGQLQSLHSLLPAVSGGKFLDREILPSRYVYYTINAQLTSGLGGIYEVIKTVWVLNEDAAAEPEATDPEAYLFEVANYQTVSTYSYYRADGTAIYEDLEARAHVSNPANSAAIGKRFLIDIADKTLLVDNEGNLIKAFDLGREYDIPVFDENSVDSTDGYAFFAQGDYYYTVSEATPQYTPVGELYMYVVPGMTIAYELFAKMLDKINKETLSILNKAYIPTRENNPESVQQERQQKAKVDVNKLQASRMAAAAAAGQADKSKPAPIKVEKKVGRNELCPCGSGKKYKHCHGKGM